jgi:2-methylcitrate dehydratase
MSVTTQMADFALGLTFKNIPGAAIREAKRFILDSIGCAIAASKNPDMLAAQRYVSKIAGPAHATIIGSGVKADAPNAALMNSLLIRTMDYNDIYWEQDPSHPSDIIPAAMACGEKTHKSTRELLVGVVIAYELEMRWCQAASPGIREIGWHHATLTQFVSPFVAARMLDLNAAQTMAAAGISSSSHFTLGGVVAGHLTNMKNSADPMAVEAGVRAALLASEDYSGPVEVVEGKEGLVEVLNAVQWSTDKLLDGLGKEFLITECSYKAYPTEALTHQPISAVLQICQNHRLTPDLIKDIVVKTTTRGADILSDPSKYKPETKETADHSLPYCIAAAVVDGNVLPSSFNEEKLKDPVIRRMLGKIRVIADPDIDSLFPGIKRAIVSITTNEGQTYQECVDHAKGSPQNPLSDEELIAKFKANTERFMTPRQQETIIEATLSLDKTDQPISRYMGLLVNDK